MTRRRVWLFDLDNTLHDASNAAFGEMHVAIRFLVADADVLDHVLADRDVHVIERRVARVMQRVVEIEQPDRMLFQRDRIIVP